jgi:hypothetical protein
MVKKLFVISLLCFFAFSFFGCSKKSSPTAPVTPEESDPTFSMASLEASCSDPCIQFFATPTEDVILVKVVIKPPAGSSMTYNLGSSTCIQGVTLSLQDEGKAYLKISGKWTFTFTGSKAAGSKKSFVVSSFITVSA